MSSFIYLTLEEVLALHEISIKEFGGSQGIRDLGLLESAVMQPQQSFGGADLYESLWDKASALCYSLCKNHPFIDGNKRTAALAMLVFIDLNDLEVIVPKGAIYEVTMKVAEGSLSREQLAQWIKKHAKAAKK